MFRQTSSAARNPFLNSPSCLQAVGWLPSPHWDLIDSLSRLTSTYHGPRVLGPSSGALDKRGSLSFGQLPSETAHFGSVTAPYKVNRTARIRSLVGSLIHSQPDNYQYSRTPPLMPRPRVRPENRKRCARACFQCRVSKKRCDARHPCQECVSKDRAALCVFSAQGRSAARVDVVDKEKVWRHCRSTPRCMLYAWILN